MRITIFIVLFVSIYGTALCQEEKAKELTKAEQFGSKSGTLVEKQFIDVGSVKTVKVRVLKMKDLNDGATVSALRLEYEYKGSSTSYSDTKIASLDSDEIDGLIKSIKNLQNNVFPSTSDTYTEVSYRSRTGFEAGAYYELNKKKWSTYLQLEKYDNKSMVFLTTDDFGPLLTLIEQAKTKM